jgi:LPXTG-motif cell wall-anchored protein
VGSATLKVSGGTGLKVTNIQTAAFTRILGYVYLTGVAASYTGATVVGFGLTLPSNGASGWLVSTSRSLPNSLVLDGSYPAVYAGIRIKGTSQTTYYWIQVDPSPTAVEILDYGTFAASGSGSSSGGGSNGSSSGTGTPEPAAGGLALLALGAAGVLRRRRQKEQATQ